MSRKKKVTYSLVCFLCSLKAAIRNCLFAFYAFSKCLRNIACLLFMSEGLLAYFLCYLWVKVACLLFNASWTYKNIWMKVACLHFALFLYVKSFCKKWPEISPNSLIYITTLLSPSFFIIIIIFSLS